MTQDQKQQLLAQLREQQDRLPALIKFQGGAYFRAVDALLSALVGGA